MRLVGSFALVGLLCMTAGCEPPGKSSAPDPAPDMGSPPIVVTGKTQTVPGRRGIIAPVPLHPVTGVLVAAGDRVKKDQPLVKLDADEPEADVRVKQAALEGAHIALTEARRYLEAVKKSGSNLPEQAYHEARVAVLKAEQNERSAVAELQSSKAELEHYTITAPIDGVVCWLDVYPGTVSRPGTTVWGEIMDLSEIDVRCELTPEQVDQVAVGQAAEVRQGGKKRASGTGRVAYVGIAADQQTGLVPVVVRLPNPQERLRCNVEVQVTFGK